MFDWITHNKGLFLNSYTEIGTSHPHAMELQTQHNHFAMNCMVRLSGELYAVREGILGNGTHTDPIPARSQEAGCLF